MRLFLAPMEGVVDAIMRDTICRIGGIDACVTEFIRVTDHQYPDKVFFRRCPELHNNSRTYGDIPVRVQLLGGKPEPIAANAQRLAELGAAAIDLNFGCPAKTVNKNDGGACLLQEPNRVHDIVYAVRQAVPQPTPVTAKIRLGFNDRSSYLDNAMAAANGGANELTVHARSKADGYRPPAYWEYIANIREQLSIPVIANGDIWTLDDFKRCQSITGCNDFMLGRGLLSQPGLAMQIKSHQAGAQGKTLDWQQLSTILLTFFSATACQYPSQYMGNRLKQWLHYLTRHYDQAKNLFEEIKRCREQQSITQAIIRSSNQWGL
ncbi:MAG: tRNA-dihydrouridine synthase [Pseudomonadota bacterium]